MKRLVFLAVLLFCARASADGVAMRAPMPKRGLVFEIGFPSSEVGFWFNDWIGIGVHARLPFSVIGAEVALRRTLVGEKRSGFGLDGLIAFGLDVPILAPSFVATATASLAGRYYGQTFFVQVAASAPTALRLADPFEARIPVLGELWVGGRAPSLWIGIHIAGGVALVPPQRPSPVVQVGLAMGLEL
jgi:hypothetical protein